MHVKEWKVLRGEIRSPEFSVLYQFNDQLLNHASRGIPTGLVFSENNVYLKFNFLSDEFY